MGTSPTYSRYLSVLSDCISENVSDVIRGASGRLSSAAFQPFGKSLGTGGLLGRDFSWTWPNRAGHGCCSAGRCWAMLDVSCLTLRHYECMSSSGGCCGISIHSRAAGSSWIFPKPAQADEPRPIKHWWVDKAKQNNSSCFSLFHPLWKMQGTKHTGKLKESTLSMK